MDVARHKEHRALHRRVDRVDYRLDHGLQAALSRLTRLRTAGRLAPAAYKVVRVQEEVGLASLPDQVPKQIIEAFQRGIPIVLATRGRT
jgi:hypothetical protein